ncbi:hypothetical protein GCM10023195_44380 [Actinoallomurus liliacearum]|uniref:CBM2 domain-containing protein n=1 Tax=Actinoallomurus liliacearum TaxID=1080073 RepID=A0ABP8TP58_9ACTN
MAMGDRDGEEVLPHLRTTEEIQRPARPIPATDVQVVPAPEPPSAPPAAPVTVQERVSIPPPPYGAPPTVEQSVPVLPGGPRRPAGPSRPGRRVPRRLGLIAAAVVGVLLVAVVALLTVSGTSADDPDQPATTPCRHLPCVPSSNPSTAAPAAQVAYRTVERDAGYFEGTVTIANHGDRPMPSWTLSFTYPGADIRNTWDAVLQRRGTETVLTGKTTSPPIAPGATLQVRFGGSGSPSMPTDCRLNGAPCAFVAG